MTSPQRALAEALLHGRVLHEIAEGDYQTPEGACPASLRVERQAAVAPILRALDRVAERRATEKSYDRPVIARLLLVVDQLEELFSASVSEAERDAFVGLIAGAAARGLGRGRRITHRSKKAAAASASASFAS